MSPVTAVKSGFIEAFNFSGRARRPEYWWFFAFVFVGATVIGALETAVLGQSGLVLRFFQILIFVPFLTVGWRRLQDTGRPGWYLLIPVAVTVLTWVVIGSAPAQIAPEGASVVAPPPGQGLGGDLSPALIGLFMLAQVIAGAVIVWWMIKPSQRGPNRYGPEPRVR
ncbi:DUF805 domain-containing protein [Rhodobacteraceae bacterium 2376]|uniref:DUF805 domain-containing protein n=1 Tax=Rhabdonatronobacter sediminivivens TaxID=2743469 RepID=A0A7Z0I1U7_9RHOB|nr:DUF805 domain-containing protein [Rhabdonatronobacter sediminivivens]NYS26275.1 DUF805 domain-containing protein [Rhabdonatronobacter sediminivivens]